MYGNEQKIMGAGYAAIGSTQYEQMTPPTEARAVQQSLMRLRSTAGDVGMCIDAMRNRLEAVMISPQPEKAQSVGGAAASVACSPLTMEIDSIARELALMAEAMRSYMQRLEV